MARRRHIAPGAVAVRLPVEPVQAAEIQQADVKLGQEITVVQAIKVRLPMVRSSRPPGRSKRGSGSSGIRVAAGRSIFDRGGRVAARRNPDRRKAQSAPA